MTPDQTEIKDDESVQNSLSSFEKKNLTLLVLSYAFLMSCLSLIVGTSSVEVESLGKGDIDYTSIAPVAFALFMFGTAFISIATTYIFRYGRKIGFLIGNMFGITGAILGAISIHTQSMPLLMFSYIPLGASNGIGNYVRFAAVEVVPSEFHALAVTLVLSGGVISAFAGPEAAQGTKFIFASEKFLNIFVMLAVFNLIMATLVSLVKFPPQHKKETDSTSPAAVISSNDVESEHEANKKDVTFLSLFRSRGFWIPALIATLSWGIMTMPMSISRVAMEDVGYSPRQSLSVIEAHFLGMFSPGFISGKIIKKNGYIVSLIIAVTSFVIGLIFNLVSRSKEEGTIATWMLGLFFIGAAWNFGFASGTVLLTRVYANSPDLKPKIQACNDFLMFAVSGTMIVSTGYIYKPRGVGYGGGKLFGWRVVNYVALGYVGILSLVVLFGYISKRKEKIQLEATNTGKQDDIEMVETGEFA